MQRQITALLAMFALLLALPAMLPAAAQDGFALFRQFVSQPAVTFQFRQISFDSNGVAVSENNGTLAYHRPGKFRLKYDTPSFPLIVSNGEQVWYYEEELEQVIIQPMADAQRSALWQVLSSGDLTALEKHYVITAGIAGDMRSLNAESPRGEGDVKLISLRFDAASGALRQVEIADHFGSRVLMEIGEIEYAAASELFVFEPPAGTEIIQAPSQ